LGKDLSKTAQPELSFDLAKYLQKPILVHVFCRAASTGLDNLISMVRPPKERTTPSCSGPVHEGSLGSLPVGHLAGCYHSELTG
jgi:hypothetical protein